jgi:hypothetical protein
VELLSMSVCVQYNNVLVVHVPAAGAEEGDRSYRSKER